jgi:hypothetical protein
VILTLSGENLTGTNLGVNVQNMLASNAAISKLGLEELKLYGNKFI